MMFYFKQKAERAHVLGSCGRSKEYWLAFEKQKLGFKSGTLLAVWSWLNLSVSHFKWLYLWNGEDMASFLDWKHKIIICD